MFLGIQLVLKENKQNLVNAEKQLLKLNASQWEVVFSQKFPFCSTINYGVG